MRTALELVPWLQASRANKHKPPFDCDAFDDGCGRDDRSKGLIHCGYVDRDQWVGDMPDLPPYVGDPFTVRKQIDITGLKVCPGWLVRQAAVCEAAQAYTALESGCLTEAFPGGESVVYDAAMILMSAYSKQIEMPDGD